MNEMAVTPLAASPGVGLMILKSLGMLFLVLGIMIGILYLLKRMSQARNGIRDKSMIRHMTTFYMAPKEKVVLLDVMGRKILIGVTPQTISHIADLDHIQEGDLTCEPPRAQESFLKTLMTRLSREGSLKDKDEAPILHKAGTAS